MKIAVYCGSAVGKNPLYKQAAHELGAALAKQQIGIVYGGSNIGLMGTLAEAALQNNGQVIGVMPTNLQKREVTHTELTEIHIVENMHVRKATMVDLADAFVALPGGCGTLDEYFEVFTWAQIGLHEKPVILLNIDGFYDSLIQHFERMFYEGFVQESHREFLKIASTAEDVIRIITTK